MTDELVKELIETIKTFKEIDTCCAILSGIFAITLIAYLVIEFSFIKKKRNGSKNIKQV